MGGGFTWAAYCVVQSLGGQELLCYFAATVFAAVFAEIMARVRKYPAISYLISSLLPLIPGAGVYYTMNYAVRGQMDLFAAEGMHTIAIAGILAVGILLVSTTFRMYADQKLKRK